MSNITTIAKEAEVSIATVSRALRNPEEARTDNQHRIVDIARQLGYDFNKRKKRVLSRKTKQIVFLSFSKTLSPEALYDEGTYLPIVNGINKVIGKDGYNLIVSDVGIDEKPPPSLLRDDVDGIIFHGFMSHEFYEQYIKHLPHVGIQHYDARLKCNWVMTDQWGIAYNSVEYLYSRGHRRIAYLSDFLESYHAQERFRGYRDGLNFFKLPFDEALVQNWQRIRINGIVPYETELPDYSQQIRQLLEFKEAPTAIICLSDFRAMATLKALNDLKISIPDDISVFSARNEVYQSFITGYSSNFSAVCSYAAQFLMEIINGKHIKSMKVIMQPTLCEGSSIKVLAQKNKSKDA